jgi:mono/diheme cytochrome c family protein
MKRSLSVGAVLALLAGAPAVLQTKAVVQPVQSRATAASAEPEQFQAMIKSYCTGCHNSQLPKPAGGLALDTLNVKTAGEHPEIWEKAIRKLRGRLMPPPGARQPDQQDIDSFVEWMENTLDTRAKGPKSGFVSVQRLNRTEYAAAVKALVGVDVNTKDILPQDNKVGNLDNVAAALSVSPAFVDQYVAAARFIAKQAVGDPSLENVKYTLAANRGGEALPRGIRENGGMRFKHNFPADGEYRFTVLFPDQTVGLYTGSLENSNTLVIMVDGKIMFKKPIGGLEDLTLNNRKAGDGRAQIVDRFKKIPIQVQAGVRDVVIGFVERSRFESTANTVGGFGGNQPGLGDIEITGPYKPTGVSTVSHSLIYVCDPKTAGEAACAKQIAQNLAKRAFRRPATEADIARLMPFYESGRRGPQARAERERDGSKPPVKGEAVNNDGGSFDQGIERLVAAVLASPDFLYRTIRGPAGTKTNTEFALTDLELASRLSFFLWNTGPDDELLNLAISNSLSKPGVLDAQVKRMLNDPRASSLVSSFAMKWLSLDDLDTVKPDPKIFGQSFNDALRQDFTREVESFMGSILLEDRSVVDLLTAKHTFVNQRLAQHYGIQGITGTQFRKIELADETRFGLLGKAAVLMRTSYPDRTSPVLRGAWVLGRLQGTPPTPPPPDVETDLKQTEGEKPKTVRERLELHRDKATCRQCHGVIDPPGLALENFDPIGRWRNTDSQAENAKIDASSVLPNGVAINGINELRAQLTTRSAMFAQAFTEKLMMYAINRELEYFDMPQVRSVVRSAAKDNYTLPSLILGIVHTDAFRKQAPPPAAAKAAGAGVAENR